MMYRKIYTLANFFTCCFCFILRSANL